MRCVWRLATPGDLAISAKKAALPEQPAKLTLRSPEVKQVARDIAVLALERHKQELRFKVRQREQLRRALVKAAEMLQWDTNGIESDDPVEVASKDVMKLVRAGQKQLAKELEDEVAEKKAEAQQLKKVAKTLLKAAKDKKTEWPYMLTYNYTAKGPTQGLVTKVAELELEEPQNAEDAAATIEKKLPRWTDLKDQMVVELKKKQAVLEEMRKGLPEFVDSSKGLLSEVFAILP